MPAILAAIINWLIKPKNLLLVGFGALTLALGFQSWRADHLKRQRDEARSALYDPQTRKTWQSQYLSCHAGLVAQNAAVAALKADGDRRAAELSSALQAASQASARASSAADRILASKPKGDLCARMLAVEAAISKEYP